MGAGERVSGGGNQGALQQYGKYAGGAAQGGAGAFQGVSDCGRYAGVGQQFSGKRFLFRCGGDSK